MPAEVSPAGAITSSRNYDVYGNVRSGVNANGTSAHKFVGNLGHPSDNSTGLIYMQARYMDPATGRFVSEDPGRQGEGWFAYCSNSPVSHSDPSGREPLDNWIWFFINWVCNSRGIDISEVVGSDAESASIIQIFKNLKAFVLAGRESSNAEILAGVTEAYGPAGQLDPSGGSNARGEVTTGEGLAAEAVSDILCEEIDTMMQCWIMENNGIPPY